MRSSLALESSIVRFCFFGLLLPPVIELRIPLPPDITPPTAPAPFFYSKSAFSFSSSFTCCFKRFITFQQKWDLLASSFSTSLCISISLLSVSIYDFILLFLQSSCSVCLDWYSNSVVNWWFCKIVRRVVVQSCSSFNASKFAFVSLILYNMSGNRLQNKLTLPEFFCSLYFFPLFFIDFTTHENKHSFLHPPSLLLPKKKLTKFFLSFPSLSLLLTWRCLPPFASAASGSASLGPSRQKRRLVNAPSLEPSYGALGSISQFHQLKSKNEIKILQYFSVSTRSCSRSLTFCCKSLFSLDKSFFSISSNSI